LLHVIRARNVPIGWSGRRVLETEEIAMRNSRPVSRAALALAGVLVAAACSDTLPTEAVSESHDVAWAASRTAGKTIARSLRQQSSGQLMPVGPCATGVEFMATGAGTATHVGLFDISLSWCMDPATGVIGSGHSTVTAANGDQIVMTLTGQAVSPVDLLFQMEMVGGTGRFDGSTGMLEVRAVLGAGGSWTSTGAGWISY
jgi:hypothetical protein